MSVAHDVYSMLTHRAAQPASVRDMVFDITPTTKIHKILKPKKGRGLLSKHLASIVDALGP